MYQITIQCFTTVVQANHESGVRFIVKNDTPICQEVYSVQ